MDGIYYISGRSTPSRYAAGDGSEKKERSDGVEDPAGARRSRRGEAPADDRKNEDDQEHVGAAHGSHWNPQCGVSIYHYYDHYEYRGATHDDDDDDDERDERDDEEERAECWRPE